MWEHASRAAGDHSGLCALHLLPTRPPAAHHSWLVQMHLYQAYLLFCTALQIDKFFAAAEQAAAALEEATPLLEEATHLAREVTPLLQVRRVALVVYCCTVWLVC